MAGSTERLTAKAFNKVVPKSMRLSASDRQFDSLFVSTDKKRQQTYVCCLFTGFLLFIRNIVDRFHYIFVGVKGIGDNDISCKKRIGDLSGDRSLKHRPV